MKTLLLSAALAAIAMPAQAEDWRLVSASTSNDAAFLIDLDSWAPAGEQIQRIRVLLVLMPGREKYDAIETSNRIDCSAARQQIGAGKAYDDKGKILVADAEGDFPWEPIVAGSNYANVADAVCRRKPMSDHKLGGALPIAGARAALAARAGN